MNKVNPDRPTIKTPVIGPDPLLWTVNYHAKNGQTFTQHGVEFYEIQEALMELSRIAYENETECDYINIV